jgi:hypothetical protein
MQGLVISVDYSLLPKNAMLPMAIGFYHGVHLLILSGVLADDI